jgi:leader peptidase (prepilin peptidase)/N-methyltransferase
MTMQQIFVEFPTFFIVASFVVALLVGSFLNVVIYRLPIMMERDMRTECKEILAEPASDMPTGRFDLIAPRSRCPSCGQMINALQNIPLLSWLVLRGKCAACKAPISVRYPVVEALTAILTAIVAWRFGFGWEGAAAILMTWVLIAISVIDIDHQIIPDSMSLPLIWIGLTMSLLHPFGGAETLFIDPKTAIVGALAGYLSLWSVYHLFRLVTGKEGMGYGDFKLLAALGAWLGWQVLPLIVVLSAFVGAITGVAMMLFAKHDRNVPIPFGPFLATAGWIAMLYGRDIMDRYLNSIG